MSKSQYTYCILHSTIVDGTGGQPYQADVGILGEKIVTVGTLEKDKIGPDTRIIDGTGQILSPGFIHMHSHGDCSVAMYPEMESSLGQGITTEFTGHCGLGVAPVPNYWLYMFPEKLAFEKVIPPSVGGANPYGFRMVETEKLRPVFQETYGEELDWSSFGQWRDHLHKRGIGANLYPLVGHGQLRTQILGLDYQRAASEEEISRMCQLLEESIEEGARGLGIGLDYLPGLWADEKELLALFQVVAAHDGMVTAHLRMIPQKNYAQQQTVRKGMEEFLRLTSQAGVRAHISHISPVETDGQGQPLEESAGAIEALAMLEKAKRNGQEVTWDVIPKDCYGPFHYAMLASLFEPYVQACKGLKSFGEKLRIGSYAREIQEEIAAGNHPSKAPFTRINPLANPHWDENQLITGSRVPGITGKTIRQAAEEAGKPSLAFCLEVLSADPETYVLSLGRRPEKTPDRDAFVAVPEATIALDCWTLNYDASLSYEDMPLETGSPDTYCGMFQYIERQKEKGEPPEMILRRLTGRPADILRLKDRGYIREGLQADLVLLDWEQAASAVDWTDPRHAPKGIRFVMVNGKMAVEEGRQLHAGSGKCL